MFGWGRKGKKARGKGSVVRPQAARAPKRSEFNVLALIDSSSSVGQDALDYVLEKGLPCTFEKLRGASHEADAVYNVSVCAFANAVTEVLPFTNVCDLQWGSAARTMRSGGVTCMEDAVWEAFARIDRQKARQDAKRIPRAGSLVIVVTDGRPTDSQGHRRTLSAELVEEIAVRNQTRSTSTFVIGMGKVDDATLLELGPVTKETVRGEAVEAARAVRYVGGSYQDEQCWSAVCSLIGQASSSSSEDVFMVDEATAARLPDLDEVFVPDAGFAVVK